MRKAVRAQSAAAAAKAKTHANLAEARQQRQYYADQEARFAVLASESFDEAMEEHKDEGPTRRALKKASLNGGQVSSNDAPVYQYSSPARQSSTSNKRNQVSSPSAHYAPKPTGDELAVYFEPGGLAKLEVRSSIERAQNVVLALGPVGRGTAHHPSNDIFGDSLGKGYSQDSEMGNDENSFGHEAIGTSPLVSDKSVPDRCGRDSALANVTQESTPPQAHRVFHSQPLEVDGANVSQMVQVQGRLNKRAVGYTMSPPKTGRSSLRSSSFAPVFVPSPFHANDVDVDPNFFEGAALPGSGPGPHFITVSFIKNGKDKIKDQLLFALATTLTILSTNVPGVLIHCITTGLKLAPLDSISASHFPTTGMGACNYMYIQNKWSLQPGTRNKLKLPAAKFGKDGRPLFDKNRGYDGPDRITAVLWLTCKTNAKVAIDELQMELEGEHLQIRWKPAQKKNTKNQIVIYGIPPMFDAAGMMGELLHGLKESEKKIMQTWIHSLSQRAQPP